MSSLKCIYTHMSTSWNVLFKYYAKIICRQLSVDCNKPELVKTAQKHHTVGMWCVLIGCKSVALQLKKQFSVSIAQTRISLRKTWYVPRCRSHLQAERGISPLMHMSPLNRISKCIGSIADFSINECQLLIGISKGTFLLKTATAVSK